MYLSGFFFHKTNMCSIGVFTVNDDEKAAFLDVDGVVQQQRAMHVVLGVLTGDAGLAQRIRNEMDSDPRGSLVSAWALIVQLGAYLAESLEAAKGSREAAIEAARLALVEIELHFGDS